MAEYGRHVSTGTVSDLHHLRQLSIAGGSLVACRICDAVFTSSQALISHISSHMSDDGTGTSRRHHHRFPSSRFPAGSSLRSNHLVFPGRFPANAVGADGELMWPPQQLSPFTRSLFRESSVGDGHRNYGRRGAEEAAGDCTKPYINQLEKCIGKRAEGAEEDDDTRYFSKLDLTLKL